MKIFYDYRHGWLYDKNSFRLGIYMDELWWYLQGLAPLFFLKKGVNPFIYLANSLAGLSPAFSSLTASILNSFGYLFPFFPSDTSFGYCTRFSVSVKPGIAQSDPVILLFDKSIMSCVYFCNNLAIFLFLL